MTTDIRFFEFAEHLLLIAAAAGCLYLLVAAYLASTFRPPAEKELCKPVPVSILVPLCGAEPQLADRLRKLCNQDYAGPLQILCGLHSQDDPAIESVSAVAAEGCGMPIEFKVDPRVYGRNRKISNLINIAAHAKHEMLVLLDSDIEVDSNFVARMISALQAPGAGAVSSLYRGVGSGSACGHLAAVTQNAFFLPDAILALRTKMAQPCFGAAVALSSTTLQRIGGLHAFADHIDDDYAIGEAVRQLGLKVAIVRTAVAHICGTQSWRELFAGELRAATTARSIAPIGQAGRFLVYPFALALLAALLGAGSPAIVLAIAGLASRALVAWCFARRFGGVAPASSLIAMAELLVFAAFVTSWFCPTVTWRGNRYRLVDETPAEYRQ